MAQTVPSVNVTVPVRKQTLMDLLCTAVEGGSNYWASFRAIKRTSDLDYLEVRVVETEAHNDVGEQLRLNVTAEDLAKGIERLAQAAFNWEESDGKRGFATAGKHFADAVFDVGDATTADVVLQMTVFGELIYG